MSIIEARSIFAATLADDQASDNKHTGLIVMITTTRTVFGIALVALALCGAPAMASAQDDLFEQTDRDQVRAHSDSDGDGILDIDDLCPHEQEDIDFFHDLDGCAEDDNDGDGILDPQDMCPLHSEDIDGDEDLDGCPEQSTHDQYAQPCYIVEIRGTVQFQIGSAVIPAESFEFLDELATLLDGSDIVLVTRVEGHTDNQEGDPADLHTLSMLRASTVYTYLTDVGGVEPPRLRQVAFADEYPVADPSTAEGRAHNRRVAFFILEQDTGCD